MSFAAKDQIYAIALLFLISIAAVLIVIGQSNFIPANRMEIKNPRIVIHKKKRTLELFDGRKLVKSYKVVLGFAPKGDKEIEGDGKTPEGEFYVFTKNPESKFHRSLGISYPAKDDAKRGLKANLITPEESDLIENAIDNMTMPLQKTKLGGEIYIHGGGVDNDWTDGCIALKDEEMQEIFDAIPVGTKVIILK